MNLIKIQVPAHVRSKFVHQYAQHWVLYTRLDLFINFKNAHLIVNSIHRKHLRWNWDQIQTWSWKNMYLKMSAKFWPYCFGFIVLEFVRSTIYLPYHGVSSDTAICRLMTGIFICTAVCAQLQLIKHYRSAIRNTVRWLYNGIQCDMIFHLGLKWLMQNINYSLSSQQTKRITPSWASYGVFVVTDFG